MDAAELAFTGVARQAELVRAGEVAPHELVETYLERIDRLDPQLNAFRSVYRERALAEADQAAARLKGGDERPLLGQQPFPRVDGAAQPLTTTHQRPSRCHGFNAATEKYEDLVKAGVIDPTKVTRTALQNAASIASLMLTTEAMVSEIVEPPEN